MIDGLGRIGALRRVVLPLAMPAVVTAVIFTFISAWNEFVMGLTLSTVPQSQPLTIGINSFINCQGLDGRATTAYTIKIAEQPDRPRGSAAEDRHW